MVPFLNKRDSGVYHNTALVFDGAEGLVGIYRKMLIPDDPGFHEKYHFTPGDQGFTPIDTRLGRLGILVCWDQWYPEAARLMAMAGADLLIYPTAIGWDPADDELEQSRQLDAWQTVQRGHAIANHTPLIACNRVGFETNPSGLTQGTKFWGHSFICGGQGEWLAHADTQGPCTINARIDLDQQKQLRRIWPFFRDRRIDAYGELTQRSLQSTP